MKTIEVHELAKSIEQVVNDVAGSGTLYNITLHGNMVARIVPAERKTLTSEEKDF